MARPDPGAPRTRIVGTIEGRYRNAVTATGTLAVATPPSLRGGEADEAIQSGCRRADAAILDCFPLRYARGRNDGRVPD
jgi:hypothetical protein